MGATVLSYAQSRIRAAAGDQVARVSRDVWLPMLLAAEDLSRWAALLTVLPPDSVLSGRTAAAMHGLWLPPDGRQLVDVTVPVTGAERPPAPRRRGVRARRRVLRLDDRTEVAGVPVTSLSRTWLDLAGELTLPDLVAAGDSALRAGADAASLAARVADAGARPGVRRARRAVSLLDRRSRSRPESHLRVTLATAGLPAPLVNEAVSDGQGQWLAEPDLAYPAARLAVEYQGADHADPSRLRRDVARHMDLHRAGWQVLYYAGEQVFRHPEVVVRDVLAALRRRAPALLASVRGADLPSEECSVALPASVRGADRPPVARSVALPAPARGADRPPVARSVALPAPARGADRRPEEHADE